MLEILLIRHGQTDWNVERRIMGNQPIGLNTTGKTQIKQLASALKPLTFDFIYSSPLQRTQETSQIINEGRNLNIELHANLREIEYGDWIGKTFQEIKALPEYVEYYRSPHLPVCRNGESLKGVQERGVEFIEALRKEIKKGRAVLVSHADWIKCVLLHYLNISLSQIYQFRIDNASVSYLTLEENRERVISINHTADFEKLFTPREPL